MGVEQERDLSSRENFSAALTRSALICGCLNFMKKNFAPLSNLHVYFSLLSPLIDRGLRE
jgi:hypothetical protein